MEIDEEREEINYEAQGRLQAMGNYHRWILSNLESGLGRRIWDAGAGIGLVSAQLVDRCDLLLSTEYTQTNIETLREAFAGHAHVEVARADLTDLDMDHLRSLELDTIVNLDVIEHLSDDVAALRNFHDVLVPGGRLLIKVPAHEFLFGSVDHASQHYRRYGKRELRRKLEAAGFEVERLRAMNFAAVPQYFLRGRVLRTARPFTQIVGDARLGFYNRIIPWLARAERIVPPPIGLSLVAVARRPGA